MSKQAQLEKQKEIIELLNKTIQNELSKVNGGNSDIVESLTKKLDKVKEWKYKKDE